jgi:transcriptional regulator with XRE-family HTH domain
MCYNHVVNHLTKSRIDELMKRVKIDDKELARRTDTTPAMLRAIKEGSYDPPLSIAHKLAAALYVSVERLFDDTDGALSNC